MSLLTFSIVMPSYNVADYIDQAIESVVKQSYPHWQLIIIDDGSTDNTVEKITHWQKQDHRIQVHQQKNSGKPSIARNKGIALAKGELICFLDSDDAYQSDRLKDVAAAFNRESKIDLCFNDYATITADNTIIDPHYLTSRHFVEQAKAVLNEPLPENDGYYCKDDFIVFMSTVTTAIHTNAITFRSVLLNNEAFAFDEKMIIGEDLDLWFRLVLKSNCFYLPKVLSLYRIQTNSITNDSEKLLTGKLLCHQKNYHRIKSRLTASEKKQLKKRLAQYNSDLGFFYRNKAQYLTAINYYLSSFTLVPNVLELINIIKVILFALPLGLRKKTNTTKR